jgi:hypothetical protein
MRSPISQRRLIVLRRLLWRGVLGGALIAAAVLTFTGCRENHDDDVATTGLGMADLRAMVLPRYELGLPGIGLRVSDSSGWIRNDTAARDSLDPHDTGRSLARSGRLGGYSLGYAEPGGWASPDDERPVLVSTGIELFRDEASASSYLREQVVTALRMRRKRLPVGRLAGVERFAGGGVGDEAQGLREAFVVNGQVGYANAIGFRRGRLVASVTMIQQVDTGGPREVRVIANALDERIGRVATGEIREAPVRVPQENWWDAAPDPTPLTLAGVEVASGAKPTHHRYLRLSDSLVHWREFELERGQLGGSRIVWLRTMTQSFRNVRTARRNEALIASARGRDRAAPTLARNLLRQAGARATNFEIEPLPGAAGDTTGYDARFDLPRGRVELVLVKVRRGRLTGSVAVLGLDRDLRPQDVLGVAGTLRARLARA